MNHKIHITASIWTENNHQLYDYDSRDENRVNSIIKTTGNFTLNIKSNRIYTKSGLITTKDEIKICKIEMTSDKNYYKFCFDDLELSSWIVLKNTYYDKKGYNLKIGDVIRFGRVILGVKSINIQRNFLQNSKNVLGNSKIDGIEHNNTQIFIGNDKNLNCDFNILKLRLNKNICRICFINEYFSLNPLISPCKCSGSMKYIHLNCLKIWLRSKIDINSSNRLIIYKISPLICELCREQFPDKIKINEKIVDSIDIEYPNNWNYVSFENIRENNKDKKFIYIMKIDEEKNYLTIGNTNSCDITLADMSVSKNHSKINLIDGKLYLEDTCSKFGTLLKVECDIILLPFKKISFQLKHFYFIIEVKRKIAAYFKCLCNKKLYKDYYDYLEKNKKIKEDSRFYEYNGNEVPKLSSSRESGSMVELKNKSVILSHNTFSEIKLSNGKNISKIKNFNDYTTKHCFSMSADFENNNLFRNNKCEKKKNNYLDSSQLSQNRLFQDTIEVLNLNNLRLLR